MEINTLLPRYTFMGHSHHHETVNIKTMAASATLHCLTGCAVGEILGLIIGTALGFSTLGTLALAIALAFAFGYTLSTLPLIKAGLGLGAALSIVLAADTLSILTMEIVDNGVMYLIPTAMESGLNDWVFWLSMMIALSIAYLAAYPVNLILLKKDKGHALTHHYHHGSHEAEGLRRFIIVPTPVTLAFGLGLFMLGGLVASLAG